MCSSDLTKQSDQGLDEEIVLSEMIHDREAKVNRETMGERIRYPDSGIAI